ncbi:MAG: NAD(P)/FAD-dependent oxidoreductase [Bacteroidia bacterium]|nr:NAD(P)/FAD-dependent oxidoreductase [Bacteroidia bacterium]
MNKKTAIIIGAGPAGLTAAYELLHRTDIKPIIYEKGSQVGGLAKTVDYKGYKIDIGPHRFFSKSEKVLKWWQNILPLQGSPGNENLDVEIAYQSKKRAIHLNEDGPNPTEEDKVMLVKNRFTRILYNRKLFNYPVQLSIQTLFKLGLYSSFKILLSYLYVKIFPIKEVKSLEDFMISRFGKELYQTFFKDYTYKVWGVPCNEISPEWGVQRIKDLSISKAISDSIKKTFQKNNSIEQKNIKTSLVEHFMYPKLGTGQMWEEVAKIIIEKGGEIHFHKEVTKVKVEQNSISTIEIKDVNTNSSINITGDYYFSTMPVKHFMKAFQDGPSQEIINIANGLPYRHFISVGLLVEKLNVSNNTNITTTNGVIPDNWIYVQEKDVKLGRIVIYNNFSSYMLDDSSKVWLGLDYFCDLNDNLWRQSDEDVANFAIKELIKINFIKDTDVLDSTVIREGNSYPVYFGSYDRLDEIKKYLSSFENLFLIGRGGMHKYNNQDHSMLTAMTAVDNIINHDTDKENIWNINTEEEYLEDSVSK